jgi:hypothetical protein
MSLTTPVKKRMTVMRFLTEVAEDRSGGRPRTASRPHQPTARVATADHTTVTHAVKRTEERAQSAR